MSSLATTLHERGIALGPASALVPSALLDELRAHIATLESPGPSVFKPYLVQWLGRHPQYDSTSVWARIAAALHPIVNAYLHAPARLHYYNLWQSLVTDEGPRDSQLWHLDTEDVSLLKAFLYLSDVTIGSGALSYIPGTHWRGARRIDPAYEMVPFGQMQVRRVSDAQMADAVPTAEWVTAEGPTGTLVLADTTGWHKGGHAVTAERLVGVWHWVTKTCRYDTRLKGENPWARASASIK